MADSRIRLQSVAAPVEDDTGVFTEYTRLDSDATEEGLLSFVYILSELKIPNANPCILDADRLLAASGTLGKGAQYFVDRIYDNQRWPENLGSTSVKSVVYKRGSRHHKSTDATSLEALTREISVLGRLRDAQDVVQLLGVAWESESDHSVKPVLVLEYAELGSLASLMLSRSGEEFGFQQKLDICTDIAAGLATVHAHGFIWGDCKPENVLVFPDDRRFGGLRAKISDFGVCLPSATPETVFRGTSTPWIAPEADPSSPGSAKGFDALVRAEVYAYGLLAWAISMDGRQFQRNYWDLELQDARLSHLSRMTTDEIEDLKTGVDKHVLFIQTILSSVRTHLERGSGGASIASPANTNLICGLLERCIVYRPSHRFGSMAEVLEQISPGIPIPSQVDPKPLQFTGSFDHSFLMTHYGSHTKLSSVSAAIFKELQKYLDRVALGPAYFQCSLCYLTGFGTPSNFARAADLMRLSAGMGYAQAKGLARRLQSIRQLGGEATVHSDTFAPDNLIDLDEVETYDASATDPETDLNTQWLLEAALAGSWIAAKDLQDQDAAFFAANVGPTHRWIGRSAVESFQPDSSCHSTILNGDESSLLDWLDNRAVDINAKDGNGETALSLAIRTSQAHLARILLDRGASLDVLDSNGACPLHWIITLQRDGLEIIEKHLQTARTDIQSKCLALNSPHWGARLEPGTPLDWAVDVRNLEAVSFLVNKLHASALVETNGRISALHRAWARHDVEICRIIMAAHPSMPFDSHGNSPLSYALRSDFSLERLLYNVLPNCSLSTQLDLLVEIPVADVDLGYINSLGENALYHAVKQDDVEHTKALIKWLRRQGGNHQMQPTCTIGQNKWSALRRAVYSDDPSIFEEICNEIEPKSLAQVFSVHSPDGLSLIHELAFCPEDSSLRLAAMLDGVRGRVKAATSSKISPDSWQRSRLLPRGKRPRLTPFQVAVLCHSFQLADLWIEMGAQPLDGVEKNRFLGFLIKYQAYSAYELRTWLAYVVSDPVPNALRRFPHPTTIGRAITYVLKHDFEWWDLKRSGGWKKRYFEDPKDDRDPVHDPMISWRPDVVTALQSAGLLESKTSEYGQWRRDLAVQLYGTEGWFDSNQLAFHHRSRHAADFKSFLVGYRQDNQLNVDYGHKFATALELAFHMVLNSPYRDHATKVFKQVLAVYNGPSFCNFPYFHYYPLGRTRWRNLTRRETLLHQAIRAQNPDIVSVLLENGADWEMANESWHSPLQLAGLLSRERNPDVARGSFLQRLGPSLPPVLLDVYEDGGDTAASNIKLLIEGHVVDHRHKAVFGPRPRALLRALREVRWPWSEYAADDLGLRFLLFYSLVFLLVLAAIGGPTYVVMVEVPRAWKEISSGVGNIFNTFEQFARFADCFMDARANGTDPRQMCTDINSGPGRALAVMMSPPIQYLEPVMGAFIDQWDTCFDGTLPPWVHNKTDVDYPRDDSGKGIYIPGCPAEFYGMATNSTPARLLRKQLKEYVEDRCKCKCTNGGTPVQDDRLGQDD